jgi:hypothetical protein
MNESLLLFVLCVVRIILRVYFGVAVSLLIYGLLRKEDNLRKADRDEFATYMGKAVCWPYFLPKEYFEWRANRLYQQEQSIRFDYGRYCKLCETVDEEPEPYEQFKADWLKTLKRSKSSKKKKP